MTSVCGGWTTMIKIYHSKRARSARIIWLLEELGVPYELEVLEFKLEVLQSPAYLEVQPLGQIPAIRDGELTMFESGAILEYLLEKYGQGRLAPQPGAAGRGEYLQWFHFGEVSLAVHVSQIVRERFGVYSAHPSDAVIERARGRLSASLAVIDRVLSRRAFVCGDTFTAADIMVSYGITMARIIRELPAEFANLAPYLERLKLRPAYDKAWR